MTLNLIMPEREKELRPRIVVFGVGGAGGNAVNNMIEKQLEGVDFVTANTDAQALSLSRAECQIQLGLKITEGLGAGADPLIGAQAAEESLEQIIDHLAGSHMCFITSGMGGGTGTGAAPIIAQAARELGVLTVGVVTKPFLFEGLKRMRLAEEGVENLYKMVDTLLIIPNQNLFRLATENTTFAEAFSMADDVLYQGVKGVTELMVRPGMINLDFADIRAVMNEMGKAMMGTGEASGEDRAKEAAEKAIANPLLDDVSLKGAKGILINVTGGADLKLFEMDEAASRIRHEVDSDANIIVGSSLDTNLNGVMRVSVIATGIESDDFREKIALGGKEFENSRNQNHADDSKSAEVEETAINVKKPDNGSREGQADDVLELFDTPDVAQINDAYNRQDGFAEFPAGENEEHSSDFSTDENERAGHHAEHASDDANPFENQTYQESDALSRESLGRLQAAFSKQPQQESAKAKDESIETGHVRQESSRFAIRPLIDRMRRGGNNAGAEQKPKEERRQPPVNVHHETNENADKSEEEEQIELPAFLRRQAN
ncbi:MAG: cell division protein FtsZ [Roseovarius sp.]|nr:cell division protein FtsZ [Roseovarius sp.]